MKDMEVLTNVPTVAMVTVKKMADVKCMILVKTASIIKILLQ